MCVSYGNGWLWAGGVVVRPSGEKGAPVVILVYGQQTRTVMVSTSTVGSAKPAACSSPPQSATCAAGETCGEMPPCPT